MSRAYSVEDPVRILVLGESTPSEVGTVRRVDLDGRPIEVLDARGQTILRAGEFEVLDAPEELAGELDDLEEDLLELRNRVDGLAEAARERGDPPTEALFAEIAELLDRAKGLAGAHRR